MKKGRADRRPALLQMEKELLRKRMIAARLALAPAERAERSRKAQMALIGSPWFRSARTVLVYLDFRGEVATDLLAASARAAGKSLVLPRVEKATRRLWLHRWEGEPAVGAYGIREPVPDWVLVEPGEIDLAVIPGVAFDRMGYRLGYGGGYYDRTLPLLTRAVKVGLAYGFQVVDRLPAEPHDVPLDGIATDEGLILCGGAGGGSAG